MKYIPLSTWPWKGPVVDVETAPSNSAVWRRSRFRGTFLDAIASKKIQDSFLTQKDELSTQENENALVYRQSIYTLHPQPPQLVNNKCDVSHVYTNVTNDRDGR